MSKLPLPIDVMTEEERMEFDPVYRAEKEEEAREIAREAFTEFHNIQR